MFGHEDTITPTHKISSRETTVWQPEHSHLQIEGNTDGI